MSDHATTESSNTVLARPHSWDRWRGRLAWIITGISVVVAAVALGANAEYFQTNPKVIERYQAM